LPQYLSDRELAKAARESLRTVRPFRSSGLHSIDIRSTVEW
jgi:hypothetical protein